MTWVWEEVAERYTIVQCYIVVAPRPRIHRWELIRAHRPHIRFVSITCGINPIYYGNIVELICKCIIINGLAHLDRMTYPLTPRFVSIVGGGLRYCTCIYRSVIILDKLDSFFIGVIY